MIPGTALNVYFYSWRVGTRLHCGILASSTKIPIAGAPCSGATPNACGVQLPLLGRRTRSSWRSSDQLILRSTYTTSTGASFGVAARCFGNSVPDCEMLGWDIRFRQSYTIEDLVVWPHRFRAACRHERIKDWIGALIGSVGRKPPPKPFRGLQTQRRRRGGPCYAALTSHNCKRVAVD